jgi:hypothetical protein
MHWDTHLDLRWETALLPGRYTQLMCQTVNLRDFNELEFAASAARNVV